MGVISLTITESEYERVSGIPNTVEFETNIPATVFYTLDGTTPTTSSKVAVGPVVLPVAEGARVTLKVFATNGVDTSPEIERLYGYSYVGDRRPRDMVFGLNEPSPASAYPFSSFNQGAPGVYGNTGGQTVNAFGVEPKYPDGYDADQDPAAFTDKPYTLVNYDIVFSDANFLGEMGRGIGNFPAEVIVLPTRVEPPESSNTWSPFFNPKALVIYQDSRVPSYDPQIEPMMRPSFNLVDPRRFRDGDLFYTTAGEGNPVTASNTKSFYNTRDGTLTYSYRDRESNRWIISKTKFIAKDPSIFNLGSIIFNRRQQGTGFVFQWIPFRYRTLT